MKARIKRDESQDKKILKTAQKEENIDKLGLPPKHKNLFIRLTNRFLNKSSDESK